MKSIKLERTINLGNYQSIKVGVTVERWMNEEQEQFIIRAMDCMANALELLDVPDKNVMWSTKR